MSIFNWPLGSWLPRIHILTKHTAVLVLVVLLAGSTAGQTNKENQILELNQPVERQLTGGQFHSYRIRLAPNQYIHIVVDQLGIDVVLTLFGPDGKKLADVDSPNGTQGPEPLSYIAEAAGMYLLEVRSLDKEGGTGRYRVRIDRLRIGTAEDKNRVMAERIFTQAELRRVQGTGESLQSAVKEYEEVLPIFHDLNDSFHEAATLNNLGYLYYSLGQEQKSLDYYSRAMDIIHSIGDKGIEAGTLNNIGAVYDSIGEKQKALQYFSQALPIVRLIGDRSSQAATLSNIARVYYSISEYQKALEYDQRALVIWVAIGDRYSEAITLNNIGKIYDDLGEKLQAIEYYQRALFLMRKVSDLAGASLVLTNLGNVYTDLGETEKAVESFKDAIPGVHALGNRKSEAAILNKIGSLLDIAQDKEQAISYYLQALELYRVIEDQVGVKTTLNSIGKVYSSLGNEEKAKEFFNNALQVTASAEEASAPVNFPNANGRKQEAFNYAQALPLKRSLHDLNGEARDLENLMSLYQSVSNPRFAVFYGKQSISAYQKMRPTIRGSDARESYLAIVAPTYRSLAEALIKQERYAEALEALDALNHLQYFDLERDGKPLQPLTNTPREEEFTLGVNRIVDVIALIDNRISNLNGLFDHRSPNEVEAARLSALRKEIDSRSRDLSNLLNHAETKFSEPIDENDRIHEVSVLNEMQTALRQLETQTGDKTVAIYLLVGAENLRALIVTSDAVRSVSSPIKGEELNQKALWLSALLQSADYDPKTLAKDIYDAVFHPIEELLPRDTKTIMWCLEGNLRYLPMAALYDGNKYLVERYSNVVFKLIDRDRWTRVVSGTWTAHGFASTGRHKIVVSDDEEINFPLMAFAGEEMKTFRTSENPNGMIDGDVFEGKKFSRAAFFESLKEKRPVVHISSHFRFVPGEAENSLLLFGSNEFITLAELRQHSNLFDGVELLTLSACNTAAQRQTSGREVDALSELTQGLGADAVLGSLWAVLDRSTAQLIPFKIDKQKPFAHPYYWSAFILLGNWK